MNFASEHLLCRAFQEWAAADYEIYAETHGFDLVLVDAFERRLGVEAKLSDTHEAIAQAVEGLKRGDVDAVAVLMPAVGESARHLCRTCGVGVIVPVSEIDGKYFFRMDMPTDKPKRDTARGRRRLPATKPQVPAGVPSPRKQNDAELMLEVLMHDRGGWLNTKDFQRLGLNTRFLPRWLYRDRANHFVPTDTAVLPSEIHPQAMKALRAKMKAKVRG